MSVAAWGCAAFAAAVLLPAAAHAGGFQVAAFDKEGRPMPNVVVFAMPASGTPPDAAPARLVVDQRGWEFAPYVTVVRKGSSVEFPNLDRTVHHVKSFSPAKEFEFFMSTDKSASQSVVFDKAGPVIVYCMLHDWMRAYLYVVETPWFAKTDEAGVAKLENLPPGSYRVNAWHPDQGQYVAPIVQTKAAGGDALTPVLVNFTINARKPRAPKILPQKDR